MSFLTFLQSTSGENSSKRLAFITGHASITFITIWLIYLLCAIDHAELAVDVYNSYLIYCSVLGGFVTAEIVLKFIEIIKGNGRRSDSNTN